MSLYNLVNGVNPATFYLLPMLDKHPEDYPRFRDCFEEDGKIHVLTRTGGRNRQDYADENAAIKNQEGYVTDYDCLGDETYAVWVFKVPDKWQNDFAAITENKFDNVSPEYVQQLIKIYPKLKEQLEGIFAEAIARVDSTEAIA